jgi:glycosyltransferase involved in cell wall biosynthesis
MRRRRIGIYGEQNDLLFGGTDFLVALMAEALAPHFQVEIVHHCEVLTKEQLADFAKADLTTVGWRFVPINENGQFNHFRNPVRRYVTARKRNSHWSKPYDLFISVDFEVPPFCHARCGMLMVLFPLFRPDWLESWSWEDDRFHPVLANGSQWAGRGRRIYYRWEWKKRMESYQIKSAISQFSATWAKRWWGIDAQVIYPPVDITQFRIGAKDNRIMSVGRFSTQLHRKKQEEMVSTFRRMETEGLRDWDYDCVGGLNAASEQDRALFDKVRGLAEGGRARVRANLARPELMDLYERAKIFWHATGYGNDETVSPQLSEHFGIVTVEAMAAGCVPVVVNRGAQPEIVQHGVNGFLWNTLDELARYSFQLIHDDHLRARMSEEAQRRAQDFGRDRLGMRLRELVTPLFA